MISICGGCSRVRDVTISVSELDVLIVFLRRTVELKFAMPDIAVQDTSASSMHDALFDLNENAALERQLFDLAGKALYSSVTYGCGFSKPATSSENAENRTHFRSS